MPSIIDHITFQCPSKPLEGVLGRPESARVSGPLTPFRAAAEGLQEVNETEVRP